MTWRMSRRPDDFELAVADFDHVVIIDVLVGLRDRPVHRGAHPCGAHPGRRELFDRKSVLGEKYARLRPIVRRHLAELDHPAGALGFETVNMSDGMTAAANLARRAEVIDVMMGRYDRIAILDLDIEFGERFLERLDALGRG